MIKLPWISVGPGFQSRSLLTLEITLSDGLVARLLKGKFLYFSGKVKHVHKTLSLEGHVCKWKIFKDLDSPKRCI